MRYIGDSDELEDVQLPCLDVLPEPMIKSLPQFMLDVLLESVPLTATEVLQVLGFWFYKQYGSVAWDMTIQVLSELSSVADSEKISIPSVAREAH